MTDRFDMFSCCRSTKGCPTKSFGSVIVGIFVLFSVAVNVLVMTNCEIGCPISVPYNQMPNARGRVRDSLLSDSLELDAQIPNGKRPDDGIQQLLSSYLTTESSWNYVAKTLPPLKHPAGNVVVPERKIVLTDLAGKCAFSFAPSHARSELDLCDNILKEHGDSHVYAAILSTFPEGCLHEEYVLDLGSNLGLFTLVFRAMGCRVLAVEPQRMMNQFLKASLEVNGWHTDGMVGIVEAGVGNSNTMLEMTFDQKLWAPGGRENNPYGVLKAGDKMKIVDIKDLVVCPGTALIKLDIDGPEAIIMEDLAALAHCVGSIIAEITWSMFPSYGVSRDDGWKSLDSFYDKGFKMYLVDPVNHSPSVTISKLTELKEWRAFRRSVWLIPRDVLREVLDMSTHSTKNLFITRLS